MNTNKLIQPFHAFVVATASVALNITSYQVPAAHAISLNFSGEVDSGILVPTSYAGSFTFDLSDLTASGDESLLVSVLDLTFSSGESFNQTDDLFGPTVEFFEGDFLGLSFAVDNTSVGGVDLDSFAFVPGLFSVDEAFFSYTPVSGAAGGGNVDVQPIPEPTTILGTLLAVGLGSVLNRKRNNASKKVCAEKN